MKDPAQGNPRNIKARSNFRHGQPKFGHDVLAQDCARVRWNAYRHLATS
jgi:hypothetical protein